MTNNQKIRLGLYAERLSLAMAYGQFFMLPLYFKSQGLNETFFGQVHAMGAIGAISSVASSATILRKFGLKCTAPLGSFVYLFGCVIYFLASATQSIAGYYFASLVNGIGWGLAFTTGPICVAMTAGNEKRAYYFSIYATFTMIGIGLAPTLADYIARYSNFGSVSMFATAVLFSALALIVSLCISKNNATYQKMQIRQISSLKEFRELVKQPSGYFFAMGAFGACISTTILNLQTTFAAAKGVDHKVFYIFYTLSAILARISLSRFLLHISPKTTVINLTLLMLVGIGCMFFATISIVYYVIAALLIGIGYGLLFPIVQAQSANHAPANLQASAIVYFTLCFFLANYLFPYFGASIAVNFSYDALLWVLMLAGFGELLTALYFYKFVFDKS